MTGEIETGYKFKNIYSNTKLKELISNDIKQAIIHGYLPKKLKFTIKQCSQYGTFTVNVKSANDNLKHIINNNIMSIIKSYRQEMSYYGMNGEISTRSNIEFPSVSINDFTYENNYDMIMYIPYYTIEEHINNLPPPPTWL
jgi:hypothetical protein